jgi:phage baseplate assembly protein W
MRFIDLDPTFTPHPETGDVGVRTNERAIKHSIKSLVMTNHYERPFRSEIGSPVKQLLFDLMNPNFSILMKRSIIDLITNFEPRVDVTDVIIKERPDNHSVNININFVIKNTSTPLDISLVLERTR